MSEPENFLSRWSRRKLEGEPEKSRPDEVPSTRPRESGDPDLPTQTTESAALDSQHKASDAPPSSTAMRGNERGETPDKNKEPEFDIAKLPSLESITAETDIRVFLQKGVPAELSRAALRRAWTADPAIRDFVEMAENQWDFATGKDLPGFGDLDVDPEELRRMVADIFGDTQKAPAEPQATASVQPEKAANPAITAASEKPMERSGEQDSAAALEDQLSAEAVAAAPETVVVRRNEVNVAMQQSNTEVEPDLQPMRRPHGRALPQ